jgi:DNA-binding MarR family transcriptional regulator
VGALTRLAWLAFRDEVYARVQEVGYTDLQPVHVLLFRYPTIDGLRPTVLAEQMGISKQAMNDLLREMERKGYLYLRPDPNDGRARLITLTEPGSELMELVRTAALDISADWAKMVGQKRFAAFRATLRTIVAGASRNRSQRV